MIHSLKVQNVPLIYSRQVNLVLFSFKTVIAGIAGTRQFTLQGAVRLNFVGKKYLDFEQFQICFGKG